MSAGQSVSRADLLASWQQPDGAVAAAYDAMQLLREIYPICRSITGNGVRRTLDVLDRWIEFERYEVPSGTRVFDWEVPREWNVREAYIATVAGERVVDFKDNALHVVGYSTPVRARMTLDELRPRLHTLPDRPDLIPYRTSYWHETWGFCLSQRVLDALPDGPYDVVIESSLEPGSLTYAECRVAGQLDDEFLIFSHICHPALANDNAAGLAVATVLARELSRSDPRLSYRIVLAPATIGAIAWLASNEDAARALRGGLVVGLLGDAGALTYKRSRRGNSEVDFVAAESVRAVDPSARVLDFSPYGYDERQFCSPGFDLPVGRLTRSPNGEYPEYHTSADSPEIIKVEALAGSIRALARIVARVDGNRRLRRTEGRCEPRLGKHGLFRNTGGTSPQQFEMALLWLLNWADGAHGLHDVAAASGLPDALLAEAARVLLESRLLEEVDRPCSGAGR